MMSTMTLIVQKYGGTSVGSTERIGAVADKVIGWRDKGHDVVVVVSAMSGETNRLVDLAGEISARPVPRELDVLLSTGEQVTIALLSMALEERGCPAKSYTGSQVHIRTDSAHNKARIQEIDDLPMKPVSGVKPPMPSMMTSPVSRLVMVCWGRSLALASSASLASPSRSRGISLSLP